MCSKIEINWVLSGGICSWKFSREFQENSFLNIYPYPFYIEIEKPMSDNTL